MQALLDTHTLLWWLAGDKRLSRRARKVIGDAAATVYVSAASAWEIATKVRLGKLPDAEYLVSELGLHVASQGFSALDVSISHGLRAGALPGPHRDPFDRMLIAQAQAENLALISNEGVFDLYGITRFW